jgi:hypothetical protein
MLPMLPLELNQVLIMASCRWPEETTSKALFAASGQKQRALRRLPKKEVESADKPGSVEDNHSSGTVVTDGLKQPTRKRLRARMLQSNVLPYLVLLRMGFTVPRHVTTRAVRSYRTFSPLPRALQPAAVYFLWHFP